MNDEHKQRYLVPETIRKARRSGWIRTVTGGFLFIVMALGYLAMIIDVGAEAVSDLNNAAGTVTFLIVIAMILAPLWLLTASGVRRLRYAGRAEKYAALFDSDEDGYILYTEAAEQLHIPLKRVDEDLQELLRRKYLVNIQRVDGDPGCILLANEHGFRWNNASYLNENRLLDEKTSTVLATAVSLLFGISILAGLPGLFVMTTESGDRGDAFFLIYMLLVFAGMVWLWRTAVRNRACMKRTGMYNQHMEESPTAAVPLRALAERAGISPAQAERDVQWLFRKQILRECRLDLREQPAVILADVQNGKAAFAALNCPGCGSTARIRTGRVGKCSYCGRFLTAPLTAPPTAPRGAGGYSKPQTLYTPQGTYLNEERIGKQTGRRALWFFFGGFAVFEAFTMVFISLGITDIREMGASVLITILIEALVFGALGIWLIRKGIRIHRELHLAGHCDYLFCQSREPEISPAEIAGSIGWKEDRVCRLLPSLFRRGILQESACSWDGEKVVLTDAAHRQNAYIDTECRHCGAKLRMKRGFVSMCRFCGAFVDENGLFHEKTGQEISVVLRSVGENRGAVTAYLRDLTGMGMTELENMLASLPVTVARSGAYGAGRVRAELVRLGAEAELSGSGGNPG